MATKQTTRDILDALINPVKENIGTLDDIVSALREGLSFVLAEHTQAQEDLRVMNKALVISSERAERSMQEVRDEVKTETERKVMESKVVKEMESAAEDLASSVTDLKKRLIQLESELSASEASKNSAWALLQSGNSSIAFEVRLLEHYFEFPKGKYSDMDTIDASGWTTEEILRFSQTVLDIRYTDAWETVDDLVDELTGNKEFRFDPVRYYLEHVFGKLNEQLS